MPRLTKSHPRYRLHKSSGRAVVTLNGREFYLGRHGTKASRLEYDRLIAEWLAAGRRIPIPVDDAQQPSVVEVLAKFWGFAERHYRKNGEPTQEIECLRYAARPLRQLYGDTLARDFGPLALKALQQHMIGQDLCRNVVNSRVNLIRRIFKWAVSEELIPAGTLHALQTVSGLRRGRTDARESKPVGPVDDSIVEATLPHLPVVVASMVRLQRLIGCRPGEICAMRPCDLDQSGDVWIYRPESHKTEHHGRARAILIGPKGQLILAPYMARDADAFYFSPQDSERQRTAEMRATRKSKVQPSQVNRKVSRSRKSPGLRYTTQSYGKAIHRTCKKHGIVPWAPNQLRHSAGTDIRKLFGLEGAQVVLGHAKADVTQVYAARDLAKAAAIMREIG